MNDVVINIVIFFLLLYGVNEALNFTNVSTSIDDLLDNHSNKLKSFLLLIFSAFSSNFDFSNSKNVKGSSFYTNGFLMSSFNIISLVSIEILLILIFIGSNDFDLWFGFFFMNFFVFVWFGKKIVDISKNNVYYFNTKDSFVNFKNISTTNFVYDEKYNITKKHMLMFLIINMLITIIFVLLIKATALLFINIFLALLFLELIIYILFIIAREEHLEEPTFYKGLASIYTTSFSHLFLMFLSLVFLKTNTLLYSNFINANNLLNVYMFVIILIFIIAVTFMSNVYTTVFCFAFPLVLSTSNKNIMLFGFFTSLILIIYFYKNIKKEYYNKQIILEIIFVLIGGTISFVIAQFLNIFLADLFIAVYLLFSSLFYEFLFRLKDVND